jgi:regulator of replication initiation timing
LRDKSEYNDLEMKQAMIKEKLAYLIIDRMTGGVVPFHYLNIENYKKVVLRHVKKTLKNYMENNPEVRLRLENLRGFIDQTVISTFREKMSNREAVTAMQALKLAIVKAVNRSDDLDNVHVRLSGDRDPKLRRFSAPMCRSAHAR